MTAASAWRWCLAAGLLAFACAWEFGHIPGLVACGPTGGLDPILAFELARTPTAVAALFGTEPCRSTLAAAQHAGLWLDALGFIPSYTAFLGFGAWASARPWAWPWAWVVIAALLIAAACDQIEGVLLFAVLRRLPGTPAMTDPLNIVVQAKFFLLGCGMLFVGIALVAARRPAALVAGAAIAAASLWALLSLRTHPALMTPGFTVAWVTLLLAAAIGAVWPRLLAAQPPARALPTA